MVSLLLAAIYLSFISLGLPDSLLGSAWPVMQGELGVPLSFAGVISTVITLGTVVSSLLSDRLTKKLGAGLVTAISTAVTALALVGFSLTKDPLVICLLSIPYGLGAGAIDAALNNYVALHFSSRHMSWLHACWGVGVSISPNIMSYCLSGGKGWQNGYLTVGIIQTVVALLLFLSLPLWKKRDDEGEDSKPLLIRDAVKIKGVPFVLIAFFAFCAVEQTAGLWTATYLVDHRGLGAETAAMFASLFYIGETVGRFLSGFIADKVGDRNMVRGGTLVMFLGAVMIALPFFDGVLSLAGLLILGLGAAPVYPCIIHSTPRNFGRENSQALVGIQMATAYIGITVAPPLFGLIAQYVSVALYPYYLFIFTMLQFVMTELLARACSDK